MSTVSERFWSKVQISERDGCWEWSRARSSSGYGQFRLMTPRRLVAAHRLAYEMLVGPIAPHLVLDHLCGNRRCINPSHLEPITSGENTRRGTSPAAMYGRRTHCELGHEFTRENTYWRPDGRRCRQCRRVSKLGGDGTAPRRTLVTAASGDPPEPSHADTRRPYDHEQERAS